MILHFEQCFRATQHILNSVAIFILLSCVGFHSSTMIFMKVILIILQGVGGNSFNFSFSNFCDVLATQLKRNSFYIYKRWGGGRSWCLQLVSATHYHGAALLELTDVFHSFHFLQAGFRLWLPDPCCQAPRRNVEKIQLSFSLGRMLGIQTHVWGDGKQNVQPTGCSIMLNSIACKKNASYIRFHSLGISESLMS